MKLSRNGLRAEWWNDNGRIGVSTEEACFDGPLCRIFSEARAKELLEAEKLLRIYRKEVKELNQ